LQLALDNGVLPPSKWKQLSDEVVEIRRMLCGLRKAVLRADRGKEEKEDEEDETNRDDEN